MSVYQILSVRYREIY